MAEREWPWAEIKRCRVVSDGDDVVYSAQIYVESGWRDGWRGLPLAASKDEAQQAVRLIYRMGRVPEAPLGKGDLSFALGFWQSFWNGSDAQPRTSCRQRALPLKQVGESVQVSVEIPASTGWTCVEQNGRRARQGVATTRGGLRTVSRRRVRTCRPSRPTTVDRAVGTQSPLRS